MYKKIIASTSALMLALGSAGFVQNNFSAKADEEDYPYSPDYSYDDYVADTFGTGSEQENNSDDDSTKEILTAGNIYSVTGETDFNYNSHKFYISVEKTGTATFAIENMYDTALYKEDGTLVADYFDDNNIVLEAGEYYLTGTVISGTTGTVGYEFKESAQKNVITVTNSAAKDRYVGDTPQTIKAKTKDSKASLTYKSSDSKIASVSSTGKVTVRAPGKATITIKSAATDSYKAASKSYTIIVRPKMISKVVAKRIKNTKKTATSKITWTKDSKASGYVLKYSTKVSKKDLVSPKTVKLKSNSKNSYTIKNIKIGKPLYIAVRSYKVIDGKYYYGPGRAIKYIIKLA